MLQCPQIESPKAPVRPDADKDVGRMREKGDVVHRPVVSDQLGEGRGCVDVPQGTGGIDTGGDEEVGGVG